MEPITWIGLAAATLTTASFVPQTIKSFKTKSTHDLSLPMIIILQSGILLWLIYGIIINDIPLIVANTVTTFNISTLLYLKIKYQ